MNIDKDLINKDLKNIFEPKIYVMKINLLIKILIVLLIFVGISLMVIALKNRGDLEEFFVIPLILSIVDFIGAFFIVIKNSGYKIYYTVNNLIIFRFTKEIAKIDLKVAQIVYKKKLFYEIIELYENSKLIFVIPSYWFVYTDFESLKTNLIQINKYLKSLR